MKLLAVLALSATAFAQQSKNPVTDVLRESLAGRQKNTVAAIDAMPADKFGFKPTPEQMSFGHLASHIVEANSFAPKLAMFPSRRLKSFRKPPPRKNWSRQQPPRSISAAPPWRKRKTRSLATPSRTSAARPGHAPGRRWLSREAGQITMAQPRCISG